MSRKDDDYGSAPAKSNTAGLVLGILGAVVGGLSLPFAFVPCLGALAIWPGILGAILSIIGLVLSVRAKALPILALILSVGAIGVGYWQGERAKKALAEGGDQIKKDLDKFGDDVTKKLKEDEEKRKKEKGM